MSTLIITTGLPGSGKTTYAKNWLSWSGELPKTSVSRDDLRMELDGGYLGTREQEDRVTVEQNSRICEYLSGDYDVFVDDTNIRVSQISRFRRIATRTNSTFLIVSAWKVPVRRCIENDLKRERSVGEAVIWSMYRNHLLDTISTWQRSVERHLVDQGYRTVGRMMDAFFADPLSDRPGVPEVRRSCQIRFGEFIGSRLMHNIEVDGHE